MIVLTIRKNEILAIITAVIQKLRWLRNQSGMLSVYTLEA